MTRCSALRALAPLAVCVLGFAPLVNASTWTVAPAPGHGVDFTNLQVAVDTVTPGDVLLVANGSYGDVVVAKGISIFGSGATTSLGRLTVRDVSGGPRVQIAKLNCDNLDVLDCSRVVIVDDVSVVDALPTTAVVQWFGETMASIERCADVRLQRVTISSPRKTLHEGYGEALYVLDSRVEIVRSSITGRNGLPGEWSWDIYGGNGTTALNVVGNSSVHVALSQLRGGDGGAGPAAPKSAFNVYAGSGGHGVSVATGARLIVTGRPADVLRGGVRGEGPEPGAPGRAVSVFANSAARVSGVTCIAGAAGLNPIGQFGVGTQLQLPVPADPSLELLENAHAPGDVVTFAVHAEPGSTVRLRFGRRPIVEDLPLSAEDRLVENLRAYNLGVVPPSGDVFATILLREDAPLGALYVWQAAVLETSGTTEMTPSWPAIFR